MRARSCIVAAAAVAVVLLPAAPAAGDDATGVVGLSADGVDYADTLEAALFPGQVTWVPGDTRTASWWVRNQATEAAELSLAMPERLAAPGWLSVETRGEGGWRSLRVAPAVLAELLEPGEVRRVLVRASMAPGVGNATMRDSADLRFRVRLTDARGATAGGDGPTSPAPGPGVLPDTGADLEPGLLLLAAGLLAAGARLVRRRKDPA